MKYIFLTPWKIPKSSPLLKFSEEFYQRISKFVPCEMITAQKSLDEKELDLFFMKEVKKLSVEKPICFALDENGTACTSAHFAKELKLQEINGEKIVLFCFGSAYGLPTLLLNLVRIKLISLSQLTFSHELAFCMALEQIYRARCIMDNHPYHHGEKSPLFQTMQI